MKVNTAFFPLPDL